LPTEPLVELAHEHQHSVGLGVQLARKRADRVVEIVDRLLFLREGGCGGAHVIRISAHRGGSR
jgi:hypothetical protein